MNSALAFLLRFFGLSKYRHLEETYQIIKEDLEQSDEIFHPSRFWKGLDEKFFDILSIKGVDSFKDEYINRRFAAYLPESRRVYESLIWQYYQNLEKRDSLGLLNKLEEPEVGGKGNIVLINGKRFTLDLLQSIDEFYSILEVKSFDIEEDNIFLELGAGYGRLAYVFLKALPKAHYIILDLPSSLVISQYYLPRVFSGINYASYEETRKLDSISRKTLLKKSLWFFGSFKLPLFEDFSFDVFINIYSLQEMKRKQIENFLDLASKKTLREIYLKQNSIEENSVDNEIVKSEDYVLGKEWKNAFFRTSNTYLHCFEKAAKRTKKQ